MLEGALEHKDSMGNGSVMRPGDVQRMSAGIGVQHSEYNASKTEPLHFLQIWILPDRQGHRPGYEQKTFSDSEKRGRLCLIASPDGEEGSVSLYQDARIHAALLDGEEAVTHELSAGRAAWVHVARGTVTLNGQRLAAGDAVALGAGTIALSGGQGAEVLVFDLASG